MRSAWEKGERSNNPQSPSGKEGKSGERKKQMNNTLNSDVERGGQARAKSFHNRNRIE